MNKTPLELLMKSRKSKESYNEEKEKHMTGEMEWSQKSQLQLAIGNGGRK